jgi:hypothetical protein
MKPRLVAALTLIMLCAACASTPEAPAVSDAEAKRFQPELRAAIVYLYRADTGSNGISTIWIDGRLVGQSLPGTYFRVPVRPGRNVIIASGNDSGRIEISTQANEVYFVAMTVLGELEGASSTVFSRVTPRLGQAQIASCCTLLENWRPGQWRINL